MSFRLKRFLLVPKRTIYAFIRDGCPSQAAALSYYTVFSLPPLLVVAVAVASSVFKRARVLARVDREISAMLGPAAAEQISKALAAVRNSQTDGTLATALGVAALVFSATTAFAQLQGSLNQIWDVKPDPNQSEIRSFFMKRLVSFAMVVSLGFLLMVSLVVSTLLRAISDTAHEYLPAGTSAGVFDTITNLATLMVFAVLFGLVFKFLPDAKIGWGDVTLGGVVTAVLFTGGKWLIGLYLGNSNVSNIYGAAASLAIILLWTYYASMVVLLGAEFTRAWGRWRRNPAEPELGAMKVKREEVPAH